VRLGAAALAALIGLAGTARADVFVLLNGDRITGSVHKAGTKFIQVNTDFGRLRIPRDRIERILKSDGSEERLNAPPEPESVELQIEIRGNVFWYAWGGDTETVDPTLRYEVRLDGSVVAAFEDDRSDPGEIRGALVNAFSFLPDQVIPHPAEGVGLAPAEVEAGRILVRLSLPGDWVGERALRVAYQINEGTRAEPDFRDLARGTEYVTLGTAAPRLVRQDQDSGRMEYSGLFKKKMKNADSFRIDLATQGD
jgi:hypothetical protein